MMLKVAVALILFSATLFAGEWYLLSLFPYRPSIIDGCTHENEYRDTHERYCAKVRAEAGVKDTGMPTGCYYDDTADKPRWVC